MQPTRGEVEERLSATGCNDVERSQQDAKDVDEIYKELMGKTGEARGSQGR